MVNSLHCSVLNFFKKNLRILSQKIISPINPKDESVREPKSYFMKSS